jgi:serine/threonine protein kinase
MEKLNNSDDNSNMNNYQILEEIGSESFGSVYKAVHIPTKLFVAIKMLKKDKFCSKKKKNIFFHEAEIMESLQHPFVA